MARLFFSGRDPLGRQVLSNITIVGIVADIRHQALDEKVWPELFLPFEQYPSSWITVLLRATGDPSALAGPARVVAHAIDPSQPLFDVELLDQRISASLSLRRQRAAVLGEFAVLALLIAAFGIYSVMSYSVTRRTHEIGLRMALGAAQNDVVRMVVNAGLRIAALGIAIGLAAAVLVTRVLKTLLYGVESTDAVTFCVACAILAAAAFFASYVPARRAASVDPMTALRRE